MTATIWPEEMVQAFKPDYVAPLVGYLTSEANEDTTLGLFEVSGGWVAGVRWQRSYGHAFNGKVTPERLMSKWDRVVKFDENATYPNSTAESLEQIIANFGADSSDDDEGSSDGEASGEMGARLDFSDPEDADLVKKAKEQEIEPGTYTYGERDVMLYNLGIGATEQQLKYTFEGSDEFQAIPTFGVIPPFATSSGMPRQPSPHFRRIRAPADRGGRQSTFCPTSAP